MKSTPLLVRLSALTSSVLLASGLIAYKVGAFDATPTPEPNAASPAEPVKSEGAMLQSSKWGAVITPTPPPTTDPTSPPTIPTEAVVIDPNFVLPGSKSAPAFLPGSKSAGIVLPAQPKPPVNSPSPPQAR